MKMTIDQIACALALPQRKIERWIRQGRIPLNRRGNMCFFDRLALERWAAAHHLKFSTANNATGECQPAAAENLLSALEEGGIHYNIAGQEDDAIIVNAVERLTVIDAETKPDLAAKLMEREKLTSTGLGNGIAVPHPREPESLSITEASISVCYLANPVDFNALDGKPVSLLFVLLAPTVRIHLQLLSRLSYCLRDRAFVTFLHSRPQPDKLLARFAAMEAQREQIAGPGG